MPIDPSIPLQVQPLKLESPMNQLAMMSDAMKIGEMQRATGVQNELRNLYAQGVDVSTPEGFKQIAAIDPMGAIKLRTTAMEGRKLQAETGLKEYELKNSKLNTAITRLANLHSPQEAAASIAEQVQSGDIPPERGQQLMQELKTVSFSQFKENQLTGILSAKDNLANQQDVKRTNIASGNLAVNQYNATKPQFSIEAGGWVYPPSISPTNVPAGGATNRPNAPAGAAPTSALTSKFVPVEGITPKPTEDQAKTNSNINRIVIAAKSMSKVLKDNPKALAPTGTETLAQATPLWEGASAPLTNLTRSADRQIVSSGYADIIDALLYLSTGAAYNKEQLAAQREAFLPAWSDKEANKIEKVAKLQDLVRMAKTRTGKAWTPELEKATQQLLPANLTSEAVPDTTKSGATRSNW